MLDPVLVTFGYRSANQHRQWIRCNEEQLTHGLITYIDTKAKCRWGFLQIRFLLIFLFSEKVKHFLAASVRCVEAEASLRLILRYPLSSVADPWSGIRCIFDFWDGDPEWEKIKIRIWDPDPEWTPRIIFPRAGKKMLGLKIIKFFYSYPDPGSGNLFDPESGMEKTRLRDQG